MKKFDELYLAKSLPRVGNTRINKDLLSMVEHSLGLEDFILKLQYMGFNSSDITQAKNALSEVKKQLSDHPEIACITVLDDEYPKRFHLIGNSKPVILYAKGNTTLLERNTLAIIGTRHPGEHMQKYGHRIISRALADKNNVVVSGLAMGCDQMAHEEALANNVDTVAILPSGIEKISPKSNQKLADQIVANNGLLLSEYEPNTSATKFSPVQRDTLVAALSDKLLILECGEKSGTMQTAAKGIELHKNVAAYFPEDKVSGDYNGNMFLIRRDGAIKIRTGEELERFVTSKCSSDYLEEQLSF